MEVRDLTKARTSDWLNEARIDEHSGISSITFRSRRPFDARRFEELTAVMEKRAKLRVNPEDELPPPPPDSKSEASRRAALRVVRAKGLVWLANQEGHFSQGKASLAGRHFSITFDAPWSASSAECAERESLEK